MGSNSEFYGEFDNETKLQIEQRYAELIEIFELMKAEFCVEAIRVGHGAALLDTIQLDSTRLFHSVCQYFNDIKRTKTTQKIPKVNFVKIVSYSIKWLSVNSPIMVNSNDRFTLDLLKSDELTSFFINPNHIFCYYVFLDFFPYLMEDPKSTDESNVLDKFNTMVEHELRYLLDLGHYDVHTAQSFFNAVRFFCYEYFGYERLEPLIGDSDNGV